MYARSSGVEHCFDVARASGSIPLAPTIILKIMLIYKVYSNFNTNHVIT